MTRTSDSNQTNYPDLVSDLSSLRNSAAVVSQTSVAEKPVVASLFLPCFCKELTKSIVTHSLTYSCTKSFKLENNWADSVWMLFDAKKLRKNDMATFNWKHSWL